MDSALRQHKSIGPVVRFLKFGAVGGSGVVVNAGILHVLTEWAAIDYRFSSVCAIELAIVNNFLWNHFWTWSDRKSRSARDALVRFVKFNFSSGMVALIVNWGILVTLTEWKGLHYQIANLIGIVFGTFANYAVSHYWTFKAATE